MNIPAELWFREYRFTLRPKEVFSLPDYKGSALRGMFGKALRGVVCAAKRPSCSACLVRLQCVYAYLMESPIPEDHPYSRKYKTAPHPYIIEPPLIRRQHFGPESRVQFGLTLIGKAGEYLPYCTYALSEAGRLRSGFEVERVEALDIVGGFWEIYNSQDRKLLPHDNVISSSFFLKKGRACRKLTLVFETPVRIKEKDLLSQELPFDLLAKRLYERACLLAHFHCGAGLDVLEAPAEAFNGVETVKSGLRWTAIKRYSHSQKEEMNLDGWAGEITYAGDLGRHLPLLLLGEHLHIGKNTTFGLGKYRITDMRI